MKNFSPTEFGFRGRLADPRADAEAASCRLAFSGEIGGTPLLRSLFGPAGFSLIEVVIALGIISFALVAVIGLLPTGLNSQRQAVDQAFGAQALNAVAQGIQGISAGTNGTLRFGPVLAGVPVGQGTNSLYLLENGTLTSSSDPTSRGRVFIDQKPPVGSLRPIFISVAWPQSAVRAGSSWTNAQGSVSAFLYLPQ
jgi:prepilin-type N-terminal cleavage/methylation domain-containing protein